jgi:hypothetical protein
MDVLSDQTGVEKLATIGFRQIQKQLNRPFAVPRSPRRQKEHGIFLAHRVQLLNLTKQFVRVGELGFELHAHFGANLKAALANTRADGSLKVLGLAPKIAPHLAHTLLHNATQRAAPSSMEHADRFALGVDENHGQAIGGLHAKDKAGRIRDDAVANQLGLGLPRDGVNAIRMNLTQRNKGRGDVPLTHGANALQEDFAIARYGLTTLFLGKTYVQAGRAVGLTETSGTRAETVY